MEREVMKVLKAAGFQAADSRALRLLLDVCEDRIQSILDVVSFKSVHSSKPSVTMVDVSPCFLSSFKTPEGAGLCSIFGSYSPDIFKEVDSSVPRDALKSFDVLEYPLDNYEQSEAPVIKDWTSPLSTRVEKAIHIYDFMPNFPPIHTFRTTSIKQQNSKNLSTKVKSRLEQSLKSESNMIKLIKMSGDLPVFINYLYNKKAEQ